MLKARGSHIGGHFVQSGFELVSCTLVLFSFAIFPLFRGGTLVYVWLYAASVLSFALALLLIARSLDSRPLHLSGNARVVSLLIVGQLCWAAYRDVLSLHVSVSFLGARVPNLAPEAKFEYLLMHGFYLIVFIWTYIFVSHRRVLSRFIWFILFVVTAQAAVGIIASRLELHLVPIEQLDGHWFFARGTFVNRNHYAAMLGIGVSLCIASFIARSLTNAHRGESTLEERQSPAILRNTYFMLTEGTVLCGCLGVLLIGILLSESRGGLIAPVLTLVLLWCYLFRGARATQLVSWISALIIAVFLVAFALGETDSLVNRFASIYEDGGWLFVWRAVAPIAIDNWFWGVGVGAFIANFELYRTAEFMQWQLPHAHSQYLHLMIEQGIPGLLLWMLPIILVLRKALSKVTTAKSMYVRKMCLMCATVIITLSVHSIWEVHLQQPAISVYFYVFLALGIVSTEIYTKSDSARV